MIPLKIQLKNFLSYGAELQTIDFQPFNLICLSGKNGHGKSALLDAITWAVWGVARKTSGQSKPDHGLLRLGQRTMMVVFDFRVNGQAYRVKREYSFAYNKAYATLEFGMVRDDTDVIIPLTDKTIRDTQAVIERIIGLDYESFVNSVFLRQGESNEFSKKQPRERKEVLATILGLGKFEQMRKIAMDKAREALAQHAGLTTVCERIERELAQQESVNHSVAQVAEQLLLLENEDEKSRARGELIQERQKKLHEQRVARDSLQFRHERVHAEWLRLAERLRVLYQEWRMLHGRLLTASDTQSITQEREHLRIQTAQYQQQLERQLTVRAQLVALQEEEHRILGKITQKLAQAEQEQRLIVERINAALQSSHKRLAELQEQRAQAKKAHDALGSFSVSEHLFERRKELFHWFTAQGNLATTQAAECVRKQQLVRNDDAQCPLCTQSLSSEHRQTLRSSFADREVFLAQRIARITTVLERLKKVLVADNEQLVALKKKNELAAQLETLQADHGRLTTEARLLAEQAIREQNILEERSAQNAQALELDPLYSAAKKQRECCEQELRLIVYDEQAHGRAQLRLRALEEQYAQMQQVPVDRALRDQRKQEIIESARDMLHLKQELRALVTELARYERLTEDETACAQQEAALVAHNRQLSERRKDLERQRGQLEAEQRKLTEYSLEHTHTKKQLDALLHEVNDCKILAQALGKEGIQALLIEEAIPEIEQEANQLLAKLTDNQAQIFIESLRDLKKGGTRETLDINISDGAGIRPYELFSGGEAFRIDFALRIAISKLLARRAGTSLQTLIIDEGFGSQDEDGLAHIMDALYKIQDDFAKIIIVSHLPSMKDQFPVHVVVEKGAAGSSVRIVQQG